LQLILWYLRSESERQHGSFEWRVPALELLTARSIESVPFQIGSFLWFLSVFPYGVDAEHAHHTNLYLNLAASGGVLFDQRGVRELVINARLHCANTNSCWSSIKTFKSDRDRHGWQQGALRIDEVAKHKALTFIAYVNILKISRLKTPITASVATEQAPRSEALYQFPLSIAGKRRFVIQWNIDESLMKDLQSANEMKRFESAVVSNMWVMGCVPNGIKKDSESSVFKVFLKLCALPRDVGRIKTKFNLFCLESGKRVAPIYHDFDYHHKYWQTDKLCRRCFIVFGDFSSLRVRAEIEIVEQYDLSMNELSSALWERHMARGTVDRFVAAGNPKNTPLLIRGFMRRVVDSLDCGAAADHEAVCSVIDSFCSGDSFQWKVSSERLLKISQAATRQRFDSRLFVMGNLKWFLQLYPNGYRPEDEGFCSVYLILAFLPSVLKEVTIHFGVHCANTMSSFSTIHKFNHSRDGRGTRRMLSMAHLKTMFGAKRRGHITFRVHINILRVRVNAQRIIYQRPLTLFGGGHSNSHPVAHCAFRWRIGREMMSKFRACNHGQRVESAVFNEMWNLSCFPNEHKSKSKEKEAAAASAEPQRVLIGLRLCALPRNVGRVRVRYRIRCIEFEEQCRGQPSSWSHTACFDYECYYVKSPKHYIPSSLIDRFQEMTFRAEIDILEMFDLRGHSVGRFDAK